jgi:hypothetical protein
MEDFSETRKKKQVCMVSQSKDRNMKQLKVCNTDRPGFAYGQHVGSAVDKEALGQVFSE